MEKEGLDIFLVGGAVRDKILGRPVSDKDYVVVGSSPEEMKNLGFKQVGADFPVFLHPVSGEEYALARTEKKVGKGYQGFSYEYEGVTLEEDLSRRDLTINAIAENENGHLDPFDGKADCQNKILRHVSPAFSEDPVRVLRVARFKSQFGNDWLIAPETINLAAKVGKSGELNNLTKERIEKEMSKALLTDNPRLFFDSLLEMDVLHIVFPRVFKLLQAREWMRFHPEGNTYEHTMLVLQQGAERKKNLDKEHRLSFMYSLLMHDFGKSETPFEKMPSHNGHEKMTELVDEFFEDYSLSSEIRNMGRISMRNHMKMHRLEKLKPGTLLDILFDLGFPHERNRWRLNFMQEITYCDSRGRKGFVRENKFEELKILEKLWDSCSRLDLSEIKSSNQGDRIALLLRNEYCAEIRKVMKGLLNE